MQEEETQAEATFYSSNGWWQVEVKNLNPKTIPPSPSVPYTQNSMRIADGVREFIIFAGNTNGGTTAASVYPIAFPTTGDSRRLLAWLSFCPNPPLPVINSKKMHRFLYVPGGSIALEMLNHPQNEGDFSARYIQPGGLFLSELNVTNNGMSVDMTMDKGGDWKPEVKPYSAPWDRGFLCFRFEVLETTNFNGIAFPLRTVIKHTYPTWNPKMSDDLYVAGVLELVVKRISFAASDLANRKSAPSLLIAYDYRPPDLPKNQSVTYHVTDDVWQAVSDPNIQAVARRLRKNANP